MELENKFKKEEFYNLENKSNIKNPKILQNRLRKIDEFVKTIDYIIPPVIVLPDRMLQVTYSCGHSRIIRQNHFFAGGLCNDKSCYHLRQSETMRRYNKEHPENSIKISRGTIAGMANMTKEEKEKMIAKSVKGHKEKNSYVNGPNSRKEQLMHYDYRIRYLIQHSNTLRNRPSSLEKKFESILQELNINYFSQPWLDFYELYKTYFICDFYLFDYDLFINIDGFFHQADKGHIERDNLLDSICNKYDINILHITGDDLSNEKFDLKGLLMNYEIRK